MRPSFVVGSSCFFIACATISPCRDDTGHVVWSCQSSYSASTASASSHGPSWKWNSYGASALELGQYISRCGWYVVSSKMSMPNISATLRATAWYSSGVTARVSGITRRKRGFSFVCLCVE